MKEDLELLREFRPLKANEVGSTSSSDLINEFIERTIVRAFDLSPTECERFDAVLTNIAELWPAAWIGVARFREATQSNPDAIGYALRRAVEEMPYDKDAWIRRAEFAKRQGDATTQIAALVSAVEADPKDAELIRIVAFQLCQYVDAHKFEIQQARRGVYLASVRGHMEQLSDALDATGLSRLAWLFLLEGNQAGAWKYANLGLSRDSVNSHCLNIVERLDASGYRPSDDAHGGVSRGA